MRLTVALLLLIAAVGEAQISGGMFRHHYITNQMEGRQLGMGSSALADFDQDGDLDFAFLNRGDNRMYWHEQRSKTEWVAHLAAEFDRSQLGCATLDVDGDGFTDIIIGGYWLRNPGQPREAMFVKFRYDDTIKREIHDVVIADIDGDGDIDIVSKIWSVWKENGNGGRVHADWLENLRR